ncbi:RNA methyltransferase substrate-binding domain-containing protein, partial [Bacillus safensis]|uniref:RNA methyltransferase substrate-binding domain-containing protein n=1 Tax=Bacillus safensis TaxID=561879 RepID=UPI003704BADD
PLKSHPQLYNLSIPENTLKPQAHHLIQLPKNQNITIHYLPTKNLHQILTPHHHPILPQLPPYQYPQFHHLY